MASRGAWLRRLWDHGPETPAPRPGVDAWLEVEPALAGLEALVCEGIARSPRARLAAEAAESIGTPQRPLRNAFDRPVHEEVGCDLGGSIALAAGMTLAGLRATAFVDGEELVAAHEDLCGAAERLVPVVVHVALGDAGHSACHAVAGSGVFQVMAASGQEAVDLSLVARRLSERALVPGLVMTDGGRFERLRLPDEEDVRAYLGRPADVLVSPTESQRLLFGAERARLLRWFDVDRPVGSGGIRGSDSEARARLGRRVFFWDHVEDLALEAMDELSRLTGRSLSFVSRYRLEDADCVLVGRGAAVQAARAAADRLRTTRGWKVGVLGITWLRPFPAREVAEALAGKRAVAAVEVLNDAFATEASLRAEIETALGARIVSATCSAPGPDPGQLAALCELLRQPDRPSRVHLDRIGVAETQDFPRRDALLGALAGAYPELKRTPLAAGEGTEREAEDVRSVALVGADTELSADAARGLAELLTTEVGPFVLGSIRRVQPGVREVRLRASPGDFPDPGPGSPVELLVVVSGSWRDLGDPLATVIPTGTVLVLAGDRAARVEDALPVAWMRMARRRRLRVLAVDADLDATLEALRACLRGEEEALLAQGRLREVSIEERATGGEVDRPLPAVVRRIARVRPAHDSLPRFWGEVVQPRQGGAEESFPDPWEASGAVPAGASALEPAAGASSLPILDPDACTGCGRCWSACPDSALGVSVLGIEPLFTAASRLAGTEGKAADALRRAHRPLADRLGGRLAKQGAGSLTADVGQEVWRELAERMDLPDEERPDYQAAFEASLGVVARLQPVVSEPFFYAPHREKKGTGELLVLAVDPRACLGCNLCVSACRDDALEVGERTPERMAAFEEQWRLWEGIPDTAGETLARAAKRPEVGELAAILLSRHCAQAQMGSGTGEPGSGERLAARLVTALVEHHAQRRISELADLLEERRAALDERARERLAEGLSATDTDTLARAVAGVAGGRGDLAELASRLDALGTPTGFDRRAVLRLVRLARELDGFRQRLAEGEDGLGRARFGVVVAPGTVAEWAARYPGHPYYAPLVLAPTGRGAELARGIARGLVAAHVELVRALRRAALELDPPPDRSVRLEAIRALTWETLETDERAACPPLLLLGDETALLEQGFEALTRLLASNLPVKAILLDGRGGHAGGSEPALMAMTHRKAFVLASSLAHGDHFARGVLDALAWPGPALIHLHAPSPGRHGFSADATLERARLAVESRAHVLFRHDPALEGAFADRASLGGNPAIESDWGEISFPEWAAGEARFAHDFDPARAAAERLAVWNALRELTGEGSSFTEHIRETLGREFEAEQQTALDRLKAEYESQIAALREHGDPNLLAHLTDRLMALAGYAPGEPSKGNGA